MSIMRSSTTMLLALLVTSAAAIPLASPGASQPIVVLDNATVIGKPNGTVVQFLGLPYSQPPYVAMLQEFGTYELTRLP